MCETAELEVEVDGPGAVDDVGGFGEEGGVCGLGKGEGWLGEGGGGEGDEFGLGGTGEGGV